LSSLWFLGSRLDRLGSKPVLTFSFAAGSWSWPVGWQFLAGFLPVKLSLLLVLQFLMGLLAALVQMANTRLAMAIIPVMGRNHFFALYSVIGNVTLGLAPIAWGLLIDAVAPAPYSGSAWSGIALPFSLPGRPGFRRYAGIGRRLHEPEAASMEELLRSF